ncbi:MAG: Dabb family protein [Ectothiorhodospiraceae bacterium]|nr:Dabb family protein [Ectothiorhodospiraceae bacterium]
MVKHIVMWRLKDYALGRDKAANARLVKSELEALRGKIPGMLAIEVGIDFSATESSADVVLYSEFESRAALDAYHTHPAHEAVKSLVGEVRSDRCLVDYETQGNSD